MEAPTTSTLASSSSSDASYGDVHWSSRRSEHAEYHASHRHGRGHQSRPTSRPRDDSRGYPTPKYPSGELGRQGSAGPRRSSRQNGYSSERSQSRPPPTRSSSRSGRPDSYVHDWARQASQSQTRQDRYAERGRHQRDHRDYRERERDRTPSTRGYSRGDPRDRYTRDPSRSRGRYEGDTRDSRDGPMSRSASHTSLASFGPGNPNPYASKPKQRVRPKQPEPPKRPATALASPDAAKKTEVKDGLTTPSPTPGKKKGLLSMFRLSRGDGKDGETATDALDETAKPPEDEGVPGIETPDGVDRGATGGLRMTSAVGVGTKTAGVGTRSVRGASDPQPSA
ncbi:hypothetical protein WJX84_012135 [Apatococcus fuscideae]|uniref:Uncharacterized protein n=1 Tax=Apatococcus fuscideae TaxID=2026836 RepID=A0AAW1SM20_9CHLO